MLNLALWPCAKRRKVKRIRGCESIAKLKPILLQISACHSGECDLAYRATIVQRIVFRCH